MRLESPCPSYRDWHLCETVGHAPNAGSFLQWQSAWRKAMDRFSTWARQAFCEFTCSSHQTLKWYFTVFWYKCSNYMLGIIFALFGAQVRMIVSPLEKMKRPLCMTQLRWRENIFPGGKIYWLNIAPNQRSFLPRAVCQLPFSWINVGLWNLHFLQIIYPFSLSSRWEKILIQDTFCHFGGWLGLRFLCIQRNLQSDR